MPRRADRALAGHDRQRVVVRLEPHDDLGGNGDELPVTSQRVVPKISSDSQRSGHQRAHWVQRPQLYCRSAVTRSPVHDEVTALPTSTTVPTNSAPITIGSANGQRDVPALESRSEWFRPQACTRTSTSSGPQRGSAHLGVPHHLGWAVLEERCRPHDGLGRRAGRGERVRWPRRQGECEVGRGGA